MVEVDSPAGRSWREARGYQLDLLTPGKSGVQKDNHLVTYRGLGVCITTLSRADRTCFLEKANHVLHDTNSDTTSIIVQWSRAGYSKRKYGGMYDQRPAEGNLYTAEMYGWVVRRPPRDVGDASNAFLIWI